jgi:hypothetical protein
MNPTKIIARAKERCEAQLLNQPSFFPLQSVLEQIAYIETILHDESADRSKLKSLNIGVFAAREFEVRDIEFAEMLYEVEDVLDLMITGKI